MWRLLLSVLSLSWLWQQHGKWDKTRQVLTEGYSWFTEGFATPDLRAARALLDE
jgi:hypothetical protein